MLGIEVSRVPTSDVTPSAGVTSNSTRFLSRVHLCLLVPVAHSSSECPGSSTPDADLVDITFKQRRVSGTSVHPSTHVHLFSVHDSTIRNLLGQNNICWPKTKACLTFAKKKDFCENILWSNDKKFNLVEDSTCLQLTQHFMHYSSCQTECDSVMVWGVWDLDDLL